MYVIDHALTARYKITTQKGAVINKKASVNRALVDVLPNHGAIEVQDLTKGR